MLKIRLTRIGKKNSPFFRVVVAEHSKAVKRAFIEILGHYNPISKPKEIVIDKEKALAWIKKGAQPTPTVNNLMVGLGILQKKEIVKIIHGRPTKKKDAGKKKEDETPATKTEETKTDEAPAEEVAEENIEAVAEETPAEEVQSESPSAEITGDADAEPVVEETK